MEKAVKKGVAVDGTALKRMREQAPLTVRELAEKSGVSHNTVTNLENGHRTARPSTIRKLASALNVEPQELMKGG